MNPKYWKKSSRLLILLILTTLLPGRGFSVHAAPGDTICVSVDPSGISGNDYSRSPNISPDGLFVVFESVATNLVSGDPNGGIFVRNLQTSQTTRIPVDGESPVISNGGRYVAFTAWVIGETADESMSDVFVRDRLTSTTTQVSVDSNEVTGNGWSDKAAISADGRYVAFGSEATNLVEGDTNEASDIFVRDLQTGTTERVSIASDGSQSNAGSLDVSISADGRIVVFTSGSTNLVSGDTNGARDIFVRDRLAGTTTRASVNSSGVEASSGASDASVSGNGRFVSFSSGSDNLIYEDTLGFGHIYVHDRQTGTTTIASVTSDGYQMIGNSEQSVISADGRYVAFQFDDKGDSMPIFVIDVHDRITGSTSTVVGRYGWEAWSGSPSISADGRFIAFTTGGALVTNDTNGTADVYMKEMNYPPDLVPTVSEIGKAYDDGFPTPSLVSFMVIFSEIVLGVTVDDFSPTVSGGISGATVTEVRRPVSFTSLGNLYFVMVDTGTGDGTLRLDLIDNDSIVDISGNPLGGAGAGNGNFTAGEAFVVDKNFPAVVSSTRLDPNPATGAFVNFSVTFSEDVSGVDALDFIPYPAGNVTGAAVSEVTGSGKNYTVKVNTGSGDGSLKLNVIDDDSIRDGGNHPIGGDGFDNGAFTSGEEYTIVRVPSVFKVLRVDPDPTAADAVNFAVTFSEAVSGVDVSDFILTTTGRISGADITGVSVPVSGNSYNITVSTGTGDGTIRLDVIDNDSIINTAGVPLGNAGPGNGNYTNGDAYTVKKVRITKLTESLRSNGANDGWVLESSEESNVGGVRNAAADTFFIGDDAADRQYRAILHFPTHHLPDDAVVTQAILVMKNQGVVGTDPFTTHQNILLDIRGSFFGSAGLFGLNALDAGDFQAPADLESVGTIMNNPVSGWYWAMLDPSSYPHINLQGVTQLRLRFMVDDNDDLGNDYLTFYSGNYSDLAERPRLVVDYYLQR